MLQKEIAGAIATLDADMKSLKTSREYLQKALAAATIKSRVLPGKTGNKVEVITPIGAKTSKPKESDTVVRPPSRKMELFAFLTKNGPKRLSEIQAAKIIPNGTLTSVLRDKKLFVKNAAGSWMVKGTPPKKANGLDHSRIGSNVNPASRSGQKQPTEKRLSA